MFRLCRTRREGFLAREDGSFSLESAFVFPILFSLILLFLFVGMFVYQNVVVTYAASITSERAAFSWDNSRRDPRSGMLSEKGYDELYGGLRADGAIGSLFGLASDVESASVLLPSDRAESGSGSPAEQKLANASDWLIAAGLSYAGEISRTNEGLHRLVQVKLEKPIGAALLYPGEGFRIGDPSAASGALITEPVSFIRTIDLARYYANKFANASATNPTTKKQAADVLASYGNGSQP
ncbi:TadE/TadG family type IV pilus assembly protein [Paenibacillus sp. LHD-117]|uniref:TadE/TadG family type IV pilus assembly protein n=1 Tax=Paenibacillus sp. LHD-117 TaxID=3071412 RepID=UPI0027DEC9B5|nr:TadE/TadG family type IV pilus assembly protein [Paenibacillus sp. LHD-117]MDQ6420325.1 TadE/TadG family type IV pilus assembly protein [Paenibacillus sp. LHD-117]